jgi:hypothetical protein
MSAPFNDRGPFVVGEVVRGCGFVTSTHLNGRIGTIASKPIAGLTEVSDIPCWGYVIEWEGGKRGSANEAKLRRLKPPQSDSMERMHMQLWRDLAGKAAQPVGEAA